MNPDQKRQALQRIQELIASGWAGMAPTGEIVDRRDVPSAVPMQENLALGIPKPKTRDQ